jgi:hypothetical protein
MTVYCFGASQPLGADEFPALAPRWAIPIFHPGAICRSRSLRRAQIRRPPFDLIASANRASWTSIHNSVARGFGGEVWDQQSE